MIPNTSPRRDPIRSEYPMQPQLSKHHRLPALLLALAGLSLGTLSNPACAQPVEATPESQPADEKTPAPPVEPEAKPTPKVPLKPSAQLPAKNHDADALAKLEQSAKALKDAKSLKFKASFSADGKYKDVTGTASTTVVAMHENNAWIFRMTGKGRRIPKDAEVAFDLAHSGGNVEWLDAEAKKLMVKPVALAKSQFSQAASNLKGVTELFGANPFAGVSKSIKVHMGGEEKASGVDCDVVVGESADGLSTQRVFLGKEDHIPRRFVIERTSNLLGASTMTTELTEMKTDDAVSPGDVHLALPDGYTKDEPPPASKSQPVRPTPIAAPPPSPAPPVPESPKVTPDGARDEASSPFESSPTITHQNNDSAPPNGEHVRPSDSGLVSTPISPTPTPLAPKPTPPNVVEIASLPDFELKDSKGAKVTASTLHGSPSVILFWGTWSLSSKKALPELATLAEHYKDKAKVYAVAVRQKDSMAAIKAITDGGYNFDLLLDGDTFAESLHVGAYPALYVFGRDGEPLKAPTGQTVSEMFTDAQAALDTSLGIVSPAPLPKPASDSKLDAKADPKPDANK